MKIAISASGNDLESRLDPRFGRCRRFLIVDPENLEFEVFDNENLALGGGAGIQSAQFVISKGAKAVVTGNCGPNAIQVLTAAGVAVYLGQSGTVSDILRAYKSGKLEASTDANVAVHAGTGGKGMGRGAGMGRGVGMGGAGMGRGGGQGRRRN